MIILIFSTVILLMFIYSAIIYNDFIKWNNLMKEAFSTMDVYLKKRWDLVPNLVNIVKSYTDYEKQTLIDITKLRNKDYENLTFSEKIYADQQLNQFLPQLLALSENYPDLKASQNFLNLSEELTKIENDIANSRKYYNAVVKNFNNRVEMFPSNIIANLFGFKTSKMFEALSNERENNKVGL